MNAIAITLNFTIFFINFVFVPIVYYADEWMT